MRGTYRRWDPAEYIGNEEDARLYLEACTEDDPGDGSLIRVALGNIGSVTPVTFPTRPPSPRRCRGADEIPSPPSSGSPGGR